MMLDRGRSREFKFNLAFNRLGSNAIILDWQTQVVIAIDVIRILLKRARLERRANCQTRLLSHTRRLRVNESFAINRASTRTAVTFLKGAQERIRRRRRAECLCEKGKDAAAAIATH